MVELHRLLETVVTKVILFSDVILSKFEWLGNNGLDSNRPGQSVHFQRKIIITNER